MSIVALKQLPQPTLEKVESYALKNHYVNDYEELKIQEVFKDATQWVGTFLHHDPEKRLDLAVRITGYLNSGLSCIQNALNVMALVARRFADLITVGNWAVWARLITLPFAAIYFILGSVETYYHGTSLTRSIKMIKTLGNSEDRMLEILEQLEDRFFKLSERDDVLLQALIDLAIKNKVPKDLLKQKLNEIYEKALAIKYVALSRRVSPWCAHEISNKLPEIIQGLKQEDPEKRKAAHLQAQELLKTIDIQAKKKVIIHLLAMAAIAFYATGMICMLVHPLTILILSFTAIGMALYLARYVMEKGSFTQYRGNFSLTSLLPESMQKWITELLPHRL